MLCTTAGARPDDPGSDLFTFDEGDTVLVFDSERFRFHYSVEGTHSVPVADADASGVPDHIEDLADIYESALDAYVTLGFRAPLSDGDLSDNGGDGRFDVYLVDFNFNADGAYRSDACDGDVCIGHMVQENDFRGYSYPSTRVGNLTVGSHELFHAVQAAYDSGQGATFSEGTAVWASERFDASLRDLEGFSQGFLDDAESPLDSGSSGPVDPFAYGASLFFLYLSERFGDDVIVDLLEATEDVDGSDPDWLEVIDTVLPDGASFSRVFHDFSVAIALTDGRFIDDDVAFANGDDFGEREPEAQTLPIDEGRFVVFTSSSRFIRVVPSGRSEVHVSLQDSPIDAPDDLDDLDAALIAHDLNTDEIRVARGARDGDAVRVSIATRADDDVFIVLSNARRDGSGSRPIFCAGDASEVAACEAAHEDDGGEGEGEEGEGEGEGEDDEPKLGGGGCACSSASVVDVGSLCFVLLALVRRRGQRLP